MREAPGTGLLSWGPLLPTHGCLVYTDLWGRVLLLQEPGEVPGSSSFTEKRSEAACVCQGQGSGRLGGMSVHILSTDPHVSASRAWAPRGPHPGSTPTSGGPRPRPPGLLSKAQLGCDRCCAQSTWLTSPGVLPSPSGCPTAPRPADPLDELLLKMPAASGCRTAALETLPAPSPRPAWVLLSTGAKLSQMCTLPAEKLCSQQIEGKDSPPVRGPERCGDGGHCSPW